MVLSLFFGAIGKIKSQKDGLRVGVSFFPGENFFPYLIGIDTFIRIWFVQHLLVLGYYTFGNKMEWWGRSCGCLEVRCWDGGMVGWWDWIARGRGVISGSLFV
jgi:hypothetical protein